MLFFIENFVDTANVMLIINSYRKILYYFGQMMFVLCFLLLTPLIYLLFNDSEVASAPAFIYAAFVSFGLYLLFGKVLGRCDNNSMSYSEAAVSVCITWLMICAVSAIPMMLLNRMNFTKAYFEAMSGYTTTGLSLIDYMATSNLVYLWRSIMQYVGGAGIAIILICLGNSPFGSSLSSAEGKSDLLVPQIQRSARLVMIIYTGYAFGGIACLHLAGMGLFDSIIHTFGALSTGGFSNHPESISWFKSISIESVTIVLMFLGNLNFLNAYLLFGGKLKAFFKNGEVKVQLVVIPLAVILMTVSFANTLYGSLSRGIRISVFESVSALTTTGYSSTTYTHWPEFGILTIALLMLLGGGTNSTAGGLKQYRLYLAYKSFIQLMKEVSSPLGRIVRVGYWWGKEKKLVSTQLMHNLFAFFLVYLVVFTGGVVVMVASGISFMGAFFEFASALSNSGLSLGITNSDLHPGLIWLQTTAMFLGRLEIMIVFIVAAKVYRDVRRILL